MKLQLLLFLSLFIFCSCETTRWTDEDKRSVQTYYLACHFCGERIVDDFVVIHEADKDGKDHRRLLHKQCYKLYIQTHPQNSLKIQDQ